MIDTCKNDPTKAFDSGIQTGENKRIDLSNLIDDGISKTAPV